MSHFTEKFTTKKIKILLGVLGGIILALCFFQAGVFVGFHKARFDIHAGNMYYRPFDKNQRMAPWGIPPSEFSGGHGVIGKIVKIELPKIIVADKDNIEKEVLISSSTIIRKFRDTITPQNIDTDDFIIVLGSPNDNGEVVAKFIRLLPSPEQVMTSTTSAAQK